MTRDFGRTHSAEALCNGVVDGAKPAGVPHLSEDIWAVVAAHLPAAEWRRVSSTCRAMYSVQPLAILTVVRRLENLGWVLSHWHQTRTLSLDMDMFEMLARGDVARGFVPGEHVGKLFMEKRMNDITTLPSLQSARLLSCPYVLTFIRAPQLERLYLSAISMASMHQACVLPALKHLFLELKKTHWHGEPWQYLHELANLETLNITCHPESNAFRRSQIVCEAWDLRGCTALRSIHLGDIFPQGAAVPHGCQYTIECDARLANDHLGVLMGSSNFQRGAVHMRMSDNQVSWPSNMFLDGTCETLTILRLHAQQAAARDSFNWVGSVRLQGHALPHLEALEIISNNEVEINFKPMAGAKGNFSLKNLVVIAKRLNLFVDDIAVFAAPLKTCYMQYSWRCDVIASLLDQHLNTSYREVPDSVRVRDYSTGRMEACAPATAYWGDARNMVSKIAMHRCGCYTCGSMDAEL